MCIEKSKGKNLTDKSYNNIIHLYWNINYPYEKQIFDLTEQCTAVIIFSSSADELSKSTTTMYIERLRT